MFGINGGEAVVLILVALVVIGPERLPRYAEQLATWVRTAREYARTAKTRLDAELGVSDVDWQSLDPRRYDPRRIVREALWDDADGPAGATSGPARTVPAGRQVAAVGAAAGGVAARTGATHGAGPVPFDDEAT